VIRGLDVSSCQGAIDWLKVPAEFKFVIIKVSEGVTGQDPTRVRNIHDAHATGRAVGVYHFLRPSQDALAQVTNLWQAIGDTMPDIRPALDLENAPDNMSANDLAEWFLRAADETERYFGVPPLVYTYPWFYRGRVASAAGASASIAERLARCPLWMADYSHGEAPAEGLSPFVPMPWANWAMWQTSGDHSSHVPGIVGAVDHDVFNGDEAAFRAFRGLPPDDVPTAPEVTDNAASEPTLHVVPDMVGPDDT
jgi:lysozyme